MEAGRKQKLIVGLGMIGWAFRSLPFSSFFFLQECWRISCKNPQTKNDIRRAIQLDGHYFKKQKLKKTLFFILSTNIFWYLNRKNYIFHRDSGVRGAHTNLEGISILWKGGRSHKESIHFTCTLTTLRNTPHHQALPASAVTCSVHAFDVGSVLAVLRFIVAPAVDFNTELLCGGGFWTQETLRDREHWRRRRWEAVNLNDEKNKMWNRKREREN